MAPLGGDWGEGTEGREVRSGHVGVLRERQKRPSLTLDLHQGHSGRSPNILCVV